VCEVAIMQKNNNDSKNRATRKTRDNRINIRDAPTQCIGMPAELFEHYSLEIEITGPNTVERRLRELNPITGQPGRYLMFEEAMKLTKAAGFVKAQAKEESRSELTETTRAVFFNTSIDVKKVKDPKIFAKTLTEYDKCLRKSAESTNKAGDSEEDAAAVAFFKVLHGRAVEGINKWAKHRSTGGSEKERKFLSDAGFPNSLKGKFLTGAFEVAAQSKFWTSLYGREMHRFSNLTVEEIKTFSEEQLKIFFPDENRIREMKAELTDEKLAKMSGFQQWNDTPKKAKERILAFTIPIELRVRTVEFLRRYESTKARIPLKNPLQSVWKGLDDLYNNCIQKWYLSPPSQLDLVKDFWTRKAGTPLIEPTISGKTYRVQCIEQLEQNGDEKLTIPGIEDNSFPGALVVNNVPIQVAVLVDGTMIDASGAEVRIRKGFEKYKPYEIVGERKAPKKKDRERRLMVKKSDLTKKSKYYVKHLGRRGVASEVLVEIERYLQSFLYEKMQNIAAHIVYTTCEIDEKRARVLLSGENRSEMTDEESSEEEEESVDSSEDDDDEEEEEVKPPPVLA